MNIIVINLRRDEDKLKHKRERMITDDEFKQGL